MNPDAIERECAKGWPTHAGRRRLRVIPGTAAFDPIFIALEGL